MLHMGFISIVSTRTASKYFFAYDYQERHLTLEDFFPNDIEAFVYVNYYSTERIISFSQHSRLTMHHLAITVIILGHNGGNGKMY